MKDRVKVSVSWFWLWVMGFMFTLGYLNPPDPGFWGLVAYFMGWPFALGHYLGGWS